MSNRKSATNTFRCSATFLKKANYSGSHGIKFFTSIEDPSRVILMIEWDSVEAHTQHRGTPVHNAMREATSKYQTVKSDGGAFCHACGEMNDMMRWCSSSLSLVMTPLRSRECKTRHGPLRHSADRTARPAPRPTPGAAASRITTAARRFVNSLRVIEVHPGERATTGTLATWSAQRSKKMDCSSFKSFF